VDAESSTALALAGWLGGVALPAYALGQVAAWLGVALAWWTHRRWVVPRRAPQAPPTAFLLLNAGIGFAVIVAAGALFAELADELGADESLGRLDDAFSLGMRQSVPAGTLPAFAAVTRLGDPPLLTVLGIVVALALIWHRRRGLALAWTVALAGNGLLNTTLKAVFARVRPVHHDGLVYAEGYSFPSGHASGALVAAGMLAYLAIVLLPPRWHLPSLLLAATLAFSIGCSRVFLRLHHASDVLAGFASGACWLVTCVLAAEAARHARRRRG